MIHAVLKFLKDIFTTDLGQLKCTIMYGYTVVSLMFIPVHQLLINSLEQGLRQFWKLEITVMLGFV